MPDHKPDCASLDRLPDPGPEGEGTFDERGRYRPVCDCDQEARKTRCPCGAVGPCANPRCHLRTGIAPGGEPLTACTTPSRRCASGHLFRLRSCPDCVRLMKAADVYVDAPVGITLDCEPRA